MTSDVISILEGVKPFYLIIPFLRGGVNDSVRWGMIKLRMAKLGYDKVNFQKEKEDKKRCWASWKVIFLPVPPAIPGRS